MKWQLLVSENEADLSEADREGIASAILRGVTSGKTSRVVIENIALCVDCAMAAVNDDYSGLDYYYSAFEVEQKIRDIQLGLKTLGPGLCYDGSREEDELSIRQCDCCRTRMAGRRIYFAIIS
jgi:hypothetical protein